MPIFRNPRQFLLAATVALATSSWAGLGIAFETPDFIPVSEPRDVQTDGHGVRQVEVLEQTLTDYARVRLESSDSVWRRFGRDRLDRTLQSGVEMTLEARTQDDSFLRTHLRSSTMRQDVEDLSDSFEDRYKHRTVSILQGWEQQLNDGLSFEILAGAAQCRDFGRGRSRMYALGGLQIRQLFSWGKLTAVLQQNVETGSLTGIYGGQLERGVGLSSEIDISSSVRLLLDCALIRTSGAFREDGVLSKAPVVTASARIDYEMNDAFRASVGVSHRQLIGGSALDHGNEGSTALASLTYALF